MGIDLSKAFDTISRHSIRRALNRFSIDVGFQDYVIDSFEQSVTSIRCGTTELRNVRLLRGVKQGDPISPVLFNIVLDELLDILPKEVGVNIGTERFNCLAYADDLILLSESKPGMDKLLNVTKGFFDKRSMKINVKKCFSLSTTTTVKDRAPYVFKEALFKIEAQSIDATTYDTFFKYLGVHFNPHGKMKPNVQEFELMLQRLSKAPLKPQQKIELLRNNLIPKFLHRLVLGRVTKGLLKSFDSKVRTFVRETCDIPMDVPLSFFYSKTNEGGMGIPNLLYVVPKALLRRVEKLQETPDKVIDDLYNHNVIMKLRTKCLSLLECTNVEDALCEGQRDKFKNDLYSKIDGKPLKEFEKNRKGQLWTAGTTSIVSGHMYRLLLKLRIGRLPTLENCNRGRDVIKKCRKCERVNESLQHVIQNCSFSHFGRIQRHDSIAMLLKQKCEERGYDVRWEPRFTVGTRNVKPDLIVIKDNELLVIDVSIVTEAMMFAHLPSTTSLAGAWDYKRNYYGTDEFRDLLKVTFDRETIWFGSLIISLRGIWCSKNDETLAKCGIARTLRETCVVRAMEQTVKIWRTFMRDTSVT